MSEIFVYGSGRSTSVVMLVSRSTSTAFFVVGTIAASRSPTSVRTNTMSPGTPPTSARFTSARKSFGTCAGSSVFAPDTLGTRVRATTLELFSRRIPMRASSFRAGSPSSTTIPPGRFGSELVPLVRRTVISGRCGFARTLSRSRSATS